MTTPKYTKKYAIIALAVLLCMSIFVPLLPNLVSAAVPTSATISADKATYINNETVTFTFSGDGNLHTVWIYKPDGSSTYYHDVKSPFLYTLNETTGDYEALVETWNGEGSYKSPRISFKVLSAEGGPTSSTIHTDKTIYSISETVTFTMSGNGDSNNLWIYKPDGTTETITNAGLTQSFVPTIAGDYTALMETWNGKGSFRSKTCAFKVNDPNAVTSSSSVVSTTTQPTTTTIASTTTTAPSATTKATTTAPSTTKATTTPSTTKATTTAPTTQPGESTTTKMTTTAATTLPPTATPSTTKVTTTKATTTKATTTAPVATTEPTQEPSSDPSTEPTAAPTTKPATTTVATTTAAPLVITHPGSNPNPVVTMKQAPLPPDYTGLIVLLIVLVILILIALVVFLKINKKKKKKAQGMQDAQ